jgi:hypothetical protein
MRYFLLLLLLCVFSFANAQNATVRGVVKDSSGAPLMYATVKLKRPADSLSITANTQGEFVFNNVSFGKYRLLISFIGYQNFIQEFNCAQVNTDLGDLVLHYQSQITSTIKVTANPPVKMKDDTIQFNANAFKTNSDATAEDLVKKMPGITVENGTVKAQGEDVKKVTVDGKTYFGEDANAALKNLSADMIDRVEVFDQMSDQSAFTGFDDGNSSKTMNLVTKNQLKNGVMGKVYGGYGTDNKYHGGLTYHNFKNDRKLSVLGLSNNINIQNFSSEDLTTATGSAPSQGRGGMRNNGASNNLMTAQQSGINGVNSFGVNYSDIWGKKMKVSGSYFFNNGNNENTQSLNRQFFSNNDSSVFYHEEGIYLTKNFNHRANLRFEYFIDTMNALVFIPTFSFQNNSNNNSIEGVGSVLQSLLNESQNTYTSAFSSFKLGGDVMYRHKFAKKGRTISTVLHGDWNNKSGDNQLNAINQYYTTFSADTVNQQSAQNSPNNAYSVNVSYTEPLGKIAQFLVAYKLGYSQNASQFNTLHFNDVTQSFSVLDTSLSGNFTSDYYTQQIGPALRVNIKKAALTVGADYQRVDMFNNQSLPVQSDVQRAFENVLPNASLRIKISSKSSVKFNYKTQVNVPSVNQLQEVWNNNNPLLLTVGNAALKASYTHSINGRFMHHTKKSRSIMAFLMFSKTTNFISNATYLVANDMVFADGKELKQGMRYSQPLNLDGYWNVRSHLVFSTPIKSLKLNFNASTGFMSTVTPILLNGEKGFSQSFIYPLGLTLSSNISEKIDFSISSAGSYNEVRNTLQSTSNNNYFNVLSTAKVSYTFWKGLVFQSEAVHTWYAGLSSSFNRNYWLWNASLAKKFMKDNKGEIKISVFDVLQQNNSITRTVADTYVEDLKNVVLQQYFMATFTYKFKKLKTVDAETVK